MNITIGADPEVFLRNGKTNKIEAAIGKLGGTKDEPLPCEFGAVQEDNVLAEYNILPATTAPEFVHYNRAMLHEIEKRTGYLIDIRSSHEFDIGYLQALGKQAIEMGCEPDFCAYETKPNEKPSPFQPLRTAGGHIHVGYADSAPDLDVERVVKAMDVMLGVPSIIMDIDGRRRTMYGKAGAYRPKPYGVEYRSLSNFWLRNDDTMRWTFNIAHDAVCWAASGVEATLDVMSKRARIIIDTNDTAAARKLSTELGLTYPRGW